MIRRMGGISTSIRLAVLAAFQAVHALVAGGDSAVTVWPAPRGETLAADYTLRVDGQPVPVYSCRVSAVPFNQVWPGYQRPVDQTELAGFAHWGMTGPVTVEVSVSRPFTNAMVRPSARAIEPRTTGRTITFELSKPGPVTVELDGPASALHLFADLPESEPPKPGMPGVRYFGPGVHRPGRIRLGSGETLYVAGGAVVYTAVQAEGATGVRIRGRGVIDTSEYERDRGGGCIRLTDCADVKVEGVVLRDPDVWCLSLFGCEDVEVANVKLVGLWRYNADGIDICNSRNVVVRNCFVRAFDDAIVLKGLNWGGGGFHERPVRNVRVFDNVVWCDWGRALEIGAETSAPEIADVRFQNCDIIRTTHIAMDIQCGDRALVHDVRYDDIRVEIDDVCPMPRMQSRREEPYLPDPKAEYLPNLLVIVIGRNPYSKDSERGNVRDITYADISVGGRRVPRSFFQGFDPEHAVQDILIENLRFNGKPAGSLAEANLSLGKHVSQVRLAGASPTGEEFVGPFPSWRDARRDFGARADGLTDDTAALQRALDDLTTHTNSCVLYLPGGTYRLTRTLKTVRQAHTDGQGVALIGEHPGRTTLRWDGTNGGTMFQWDAWYSKISRLTFDGAGRAGTGLLYGPAFSTYNETSDLWFRDTTHGLVFGGPQTAGQAENAVLRCRFLRCGVGIQTVNWNSMDIWVWYGRFEDCGRGVHNVMGNWHVWESLFFRSREADLSSLNLMAFSAVNNTSIGSRCFFDFGTGHTWGSPVSLTGNRVLDPTGDWAAILDNAGPYLVVDNQFRLAGPGRAVRMTWADQTLVGNVYSQTNAVEERGRFRRLAERVVPASAISDPLPGLPSAPPSYRRQVLEVRAGAGADAIQEAIDDAAKLTGQRPVVHLPMGRYPVAKTIRIPAGCDLQLIGDSAGETGTRLDWTGPADGVLLRVQGPSHATLRDFYLHAGPARALAIENADQPGGRIFADQLNANGPSTPGTPAAAAVRLRGLAHTDVLLRSLQGSGNAGRWVEVEGRSNAGPTTNQICIFTGATGSAVGQYNVRGGGQLVVRAVYHERSSDSLSGLRLTDTGTLSIDATRFSYATSTSAPTIAADDFHGLFTLATCILMPVETAATCRFELRGNGGEASVLALNNQFWIQQRTTADDVWRNLAHPPARGGLIGCNVNTSHPEAAPKGYGYASLANVREHTDPAKSASGSGPLEDRGTVDDVTLLQHLAPLRAARVWLPNGAGSVDVTDLRIHRVMATGGTGAVVEIQSQAGTAH